MPGVHWTLFYLKQKLRPWQNRLRPYRVELVIAVVAVVIAIALDAVLTAVAPPLWRVERAHRAGDPATVEILYWQALQEGPIDVPVLLEFLEMNDFLRQIVSVEIDGEWAAPGADAALAFRPSIPRDEVLGFLERIEDPNVRRIGLYWLNMLEGTAGEAEAESIVADADEEPAVPWCNHLLAREAMNDADLWTAAARYEREGLRPGGPVADLKTAIGLYDSLGLVEEMRRCADDPRFARAVDPLLRSDLAYSERDWPGWLLWLFPAIYVRGDISSWLLAAVALGLWFWFCRRLGATSLGTGWMAAAVALGALSIYPTHLLITAGDAIGLEQTGELVADAIFFCAGVGFREEGAKLLLFLPLLVVAKRRLGNGNALVLGALVGLGFAAVENVGYFSIGDLSTGLGRFLTANFLHMALTAIVADAAYKVAIRQYDAVANLSRTFGLAVILHGAYDLFLSSPQLAEYSFAAMTTFVVISRLFLRAVPLAHAGGGPALYRVLVRSLVILCAASYVYGAAIAGPAIAASSLVQGLFGVALIIYMFHHELRVG